MNIAEVATVAARFGRGAMGDASVAWKGAQAYVLSYDRTVLLRAEGVPNNGAGLRLVDPGYRYTEAVPQPAPFPCDRYLDRKAWAWLGQNARALPQPVTFWNIGGEWDPQRGMTPALQGDGVATAQAVKGYVN